MNKIMLIGRLTRDPELKYLPNTGTAVSTFTLAVDRPTAKDKEQEADFIQCVAWGKTAEFVANYFKKGGLSFVEGRLQIRSYEKDGEKKYVTEVIVSSVEKLDWGKDRPEELLEE